MIVGVTGWKNSGKTTLAVRLIEEFTRRGHSVASLKNSHSARQVDVPGTDTHRHAQAGANTVTLVGDDGWSQIRYGAPLPVDRLPELCAGAQIVVAEGFKQAPWEKVACLGTSDTSIVEASRNVVALAVARPLSSPHPVFDRDDIAAIADFWLAR